MTARLTSAMLASALMRRVQSAGGHAALLARGDEISGSILIQSLEKGRISGLWERLLSPDGLYQWQRVGPQDIVGDDEYDHYIERRRARDPDLWLIELDIVNAERFIVDSASEA
jgi:hypothetical protein